MPNEWNDWDTGKQGNFANLSISDADLRKRNILGEINTATLEDFQNYLYEQQMRNNILRATSQTTPENLAASQVAVQGLAGNKYKARDIGAMWDEFGAVGEDPTKMQDPTQLASYLSRSGIKPDIAREALEQKAYLKSQAYLDKKLEAEAQLKREEIARKEKAALEKQKDVDEKLKHEQQKTHEANIAKMEAQRAIDLKNIETDKNIIGEGGFLGFGGKSAADIRKAAYKARELYWDTKIANYQKMAGMGSGATSQTNSKAALAAQKYGGTVNPDGTITIQGKIYKVN